MEDDDLEEKSEVDKALLFKELALEIFPIDSWEDWEIRCLCRIGLADWFGLGDECED